MTAKDAMNIYDIILEQLERIQINYNKPDLAKDIVNELDKSGYLKGKKGIKK